MRKLCRVPSQATDVPVPGYKYTKEARNEVLTNLKLDESVVNMKLKDDEWIKLAAEKAKREDMDNVIAESNIRAPNARTKKEKLIAILNFVQAEDGDDEDE